jgi:hypothetical protein
MERNDFGEHKLLVSHQANTKAKIPEKATIMLDILTLPPYYLLGHHSKKVLPLDT